MKFFQICKELSKFSDHRQHKIGAVIVLKNRVIGTGFNKLKTHPLSPHPFKSCHSEFMSVHSIIDKSKLQGADIYIARYHRDEKEAIAKPCETCEKLLRQVGIKNVYFTCNGFYGSMKL